MNTQPDNTSLDKATSLRLRQLAAAPVDTTRLETMLQASLAAATAPQAQPRHRLTLRHWMRPIVSLAASLALAAVIITGLLLSGQNPVVASPIELTALHSQIVTGQLPVTRVSSMAQARDAIARQWAKGPELPSLQGLEVQSCCLTNVHGKLVAAVLLEVEGKAVTLIVADARDFVMPHGTVVQRNGRAIVTHQNAGLDMAMTRQGDRWLCVMGDLPVDTLVTLAANAF